MIFKAISRLFGNADSNQHQTAIHEANVPTVQQSSLPTYVSDTEMEAAFELAIQMHNNILKRLVREHSGVLRRKIKQRLRRDDYGNEIGFDEAANEVSYFLSHVAGVDDEYREARERCINIKINALMFGRNRENYDIDRLTADIQEKFDDELVGYVYILATKDDEDGSANTIDIESMSGGDFECYCEERLTVLGWSVCRKGGTGDQGVDLLASKDGTVVAIQCKRYASTVGNHAIQEVEAGRQFEDAHFAAVISNSSFSKSAVVLAFKLNVALLHVSELESLAHRFRR